MKRYLFIDGELNGGGAERVLLDILNNFDYENIQVGLLQITGGGTLLDEVPKEVNVIEVWHGYPLSYRLALRCSLWFGWQWPLRSQIKKALGSMHYDVAISFLEGMPTKMHALITDVADRNYSWVHCDLDTYRYEAGMFKGSEELDAYNRMDKVVCVANDTARAFNARFPNCKSSTAVIYNPIDTSKILRMASEATVTNDRFTVSICGRLTPPKKIDRAIRVARMIKDNNLPVKIQLVGTGELQTELKEQVARLDVCDIVEFIGFVRNPFPYIKASDMLLSTSCAEGFSLVICEAMTLGVPVVATKTAGPIEILDNNKYGLLCDHEDENIYKAVIKMYEEENLRKHYCEVGRERMKMFSVEVCIKQIESL